MTAGRGGGGEIAGNAEQTSGLEWRSRVLLLLTLVMVALCARMLAPFLSALTWAIALAVATRPAYLSLERRLRRPSLASSIAVVLVFLLIVVPVGFLGDRVVRQVLHVVRLVQNGEVQDWIAGVADRHDWAQNLLDRASEFSDLKGGTQATAGFIAGRLRGVLMSSIRLLTELAVLLFALFFFYRDGEAMRARLLTLLPLDEAESELLLARIGSAITATLLGRLTIAVVQGTMGGAMFFVLGVPQAAVWGMLMAALGMIPMLGTFLVWGPVAAFLALTNHPVKAGILIVWGGGVISLIDNLLYPTLVGKRLQMHTLATFFSVLGGVAVFGINGLVLGPVLLVTATELLELWKRRTLPGKPSADA